MDWEPDERALRLGEYMAETGSTVRATAGHFGISKSTVHKDVSERLRRISPSLYREVGAVLAQNKAERHLRGGQATKEKYEKRAKK
ncbi:MAG: sporulation transcriptional regulator SpoIIID [Ruminococcus sp.]|nr:sporulation transcriptional regulator SpoIIID [Candidatus Apopatosoma intestinale]